MALNTKQKQVMGDLAALTVIPHSLAGQVEALLRFGDPSDAERARLTELKAKCARASVTPAAKPGGQSEASYRDVMFDAIEAFEREHGTVHVNVVHAMLRHKVAPENVKRAAALLAAIDATDEDAITAEIANVQKSIPDVFTETGPSSRRRPEGKSLAERGRETAVRRGWTTEKTDASAS
ncbi:MAG: hypothetical protein JWL79_3091 [Frankiales bacterium]|nr:hypothetical protein [Frankiales bacterium]